MTQLLHLCLSLCVCLGTLHLPQAFAQDIVLPKSNVRIGLSPQVNPPVLKGIVIDPNNPFKFQFMMDQGDDKFFSDVELRQESKRLIKYFLTAVTTPDQDLWVNLSPYEKDRLIPEQFGQTAMGRDLLAQDYLLKQITASLMHPESDFGNQFWQRIYKETAKRFGTTQIQVNTFNKVWIVPAESRVYERGGSAFVVKATLKVMLEEDYLALNKNINGSLSGSDSETAVAKQIIQEIIIPALETEVNEGKNFAPLRQIYHALILSVWFKQRMKQSLLGQQYMNQNKSGNMSFSDRRLNPEAIYQQYVQSFKKGVYNFVKEEIGNDQQQVARKYFAGGFSFDRAMTITTFTSNVKEMFMKLTAGLVLLSCVLSSNSINAAQATSAQDKELMTLVGEAKFSQVSTNDYYFNETRKTFSQLTVEKRGILAKEFSEMGVYQWKSIEGIVDYVNQTNPDTIRQDVLATRSFFAPLGEVNLSKDMIEQAKVTRKVFGDQYLSDLKRDYPYLFDFKGQQQGKYKQQTIDLLRSLESVTGDLSNADLERLQLYHLGILSFYVNHFPIDEEKVKGIFIKMVLNTIVEKSNFPNAESGFSYANIIFKSYGNIATGIIAHEIAHNYLAMGEGENSTEVVGEFVADMMALAFMQEVFGEAYVDHYKGFIRLHFIERPTHGAELLVKMANPFVRMSLAFGDKVRLDGHFWARRMVLSIINKYQGRPDFMKLAGIVVKLDGQIQDQPELKARLIRLDEEGNLMDLTGLLTHIIRQYEGNPTLEFELDRYVINPDTGKTWLNPSRVRKSSMQLILPNLLKSIKSPATSDTNGNNSVGGIDLTTEKVNLSVENNNMFDGFKGYKGSLSGATVSQLDISSIEIIPGANLTQLLGLSAN